MKVTSTKLTIRYRGKVLLTRQEYHFHPRAFCFLRRKNDRTLIDYMFYSTFQLRRFMTHPASLNEKQQWKDYFINHEIVNDREIVKYLYRMQTP